MVLFPRKVPEAADILNRRKSREGRKVVRSKIQRTSKELRSLNHQSSSHKKKKKRRENVSFFFPFRNLNGVFLPFSSHDYLLTGDSRTDHICLVMITCSTSSWRFLQKSRDSETRLGRLALIVQALIAHNGRFNERAKDIDRAVHSHERIDKTTNRYVFIPELYRKLLLFLSFSLIFSSSNIFPHRISPRWSRSVLRSKPTPERNPNTPIHNEWRFRE